MTDYNIIADHFSQTRRYNWAEFNDFVALVKPGSSVLDLGCGNGRLYKLLKEKKVNYFGLDKSTKLIKIAKKSVCVRITPHRVWSTDNTSGKARFLVKDILCPETWQKLGKFDYIFCLAVLHHLTNIKDQKYVLKQIYNHLKPNGLLFITVWNLWQIKFWLKHFKQRSFNHLRVPYHVSDGKTPLCTINRFLYVYSKRNLKKMVLESGLNIIDIYYSKKGKKTSWFNGYNLCLVAQKC